MKDLQPVASPSTDGVRIRDDDFFALQDKINVLKQTLASVGNAFIVSGCEVSGTLNDATISAGYAMIGGELCTFAGEANVNLSTPRYLVADSPQAIAQRETFLGGTINRFLYRTCSLSGSPAAGSYHHIVFGADTTNGLVQGVKLLGYDWKPLTFYNTGSVTLSGLSGNVQYCKDYLGMVHFKGTIQWTTATGGAATKFTSVLTSSVPLPIGFRPTVNLFLAMGSYNNDNYAFVVSTDGEVSLRGTMNPADVQAGYFNTSIFSFIAEA